jgi:crotonobetainyl-CoA:carnitine CoA-transferase CaiB-like acyl-CoA transferase
MTGALSGLKVLDLSRILAGPTCTQLLGDMGADVVKIENPRSDGDDTRAWGPPYCVDPEGAQTDLSAYFNCANRNKRSVAADLSSDAGQVLITRLARQADIVVENFKPGGLAKYGLDYTSLSKVNPQLVYCSITGFGQTGRNAHKPGYDLMAQGFGGIMSLTGDVDGEPTKVAVGIADVMCGMYATVGILAAIRHRDQTGQGQQIDIALVDSQIAWLINEGTNFLTSGHLPERRGNEHPNIAPYQVYESSDGHVIIACGNDGQFVRLCGFLKLDGLAEDANFATNPARIVNREALNAILQPAFAQYSMSEITAALEACGVPVGPVNTLDKVFDSDQVADRDMKITMKNPQTNATIPMIGNPLKFSETPISYRRSPPTFGEHTVDFLERAVWK